VAFASWDPLRELLALHERFGELADADASGWRPLVDLYETATSYVLSVELPGLTRQQIEIQAEDFRIEIRGTRSVTPVETGVTCEQYHRLERGHGRFARAFTLPDAIDTAGVKADLKDGVLTVILPKARDRAARRVTVT
jgi:HSP20 family protein